MTGNYLSDKDIVRLKREANVAQSVSEPPDELRAIDRARFRMRLWLVLPLAVLAVGVVQVPLRALVVPTLIIFVVLVKGAVEYRALGKRRMDLFR